MHYYRLLLMSLVMSFLSSCISTKKYTSALDFALASKDKRLTEVFKSEKDYQVQILFAEVNRTAETVNLKEYRYQVDDNNYFYPASTVKFPIAVMSLEQLNQKGIDYRTSYKLVSDTLVTSFKKSVEEIFAVSDNVAFNRLYEFLGKDYINTTIHSKGIDQFRIAHRLSTSNANRLERSSLVMNPNTTNEQLLDFKNDHASIPLTLKSIKKGMGYKYQESTIYEPFDFSLKNYYPITSQYEVLKRVIFPQLFESHQQFNLSEEQRNFLLKSMRSLPKEVGYDSKEYYDSYGKFFLFGDSKKPIPKQFKIYNKVGYAYGTLTDCAYITDSKTGVEFILIATILVNDNQVFNDNVYQYDKLGIPFLSALGKEIYRFEKKRMRTMK
jgi:hypothetical protein